MSEVCFICNEAVTNPICPECLHIEVRHWLMEEKEQAMQDVDGIKQLFSGAELEIASCIFCGNSMPVCAHCYSKEVKEYLETEHPELVSDFIQLFNFHLHMPKSSA